MEKYKKGLFFLAIVILYCMIFIGIAKIGFPLIAFLSIAYCILSYFAYSLFVCRGEKKHNRVKILLNGDFPQGQNQDAVFYGKKSKIKINNTTIKSPMLYISHSNNFNAGKFVKFLIYSKFNSITTKECDFDSLSYTSLTRSEQQIFLSWLADKKQDITKPDLLKIYFNNLSYRFFQEKKDMEIIFQEVLDLHKKYFSKASTELRNFTEEFLYNMVMFDKRIHNQYNLIQIENTPFQKGKILFEMIQHIQQTIEPKYLKMYLCQFFASLRSANFLLVNNTYCSQLFNMVVQFAEGQKLGNLRASKVVSASKIVRHENYNFYIESLDVQISEKDSKTFLKMMDDVKPFLLAFHKKGYNEAYTLLPLKYKKISPHEKQGLLKNIINSHGAYLRVKDLLPLISLDVDKLTLRESKRLAQVVNDCLYAIEPDIKNHNKIYRLEDHICLYKNGNQIINKDHKFINKLYLADLVFFLSEIDVIKEKSTEILNDLCSRFDLNDVCRNRLQRRWRLNIRGRQVDVRGILAIDYDEAEVLWLKDYYDKYKDVLNIKPHLFKQINFG